MDNFDRLFEVNSQCRVLICLCCQYAVVPCQIEKHLRAHHSRLSLLQRRNILAKVQELLELARVHSDVIYPSSTDPPIRSLPTYFDGLKCNSVDDHGFFCSYICRTPRGMQEHCIQIYVRWTNQQKRGGDTRSKQFLTSNKTWTENHACQRLFKVGVWQR